MVRRSKPNILPMLLALVLFMGALVSIHFSVNSELGRGIADVSVLITFFIAIFLLADR